MGAVVKGVVSVDIGVVGDGVGGGLLMRLLVGWGC